MESRPRCDNNHKYIIIAIKHFTKWVEGMSTFTNTMATSSLLFFNHIIAQFWVPEHLVFDDGQHFEDEMWCNLSSLLGFENQYSLSYYPQRNGQVEVVNKFLKTMLQ